MDLWIYHIQCGRPANTCQLERGRQTKEITSVGIPVVKNKKHVTGEKGKKDQRRMLKSNTKASEVVVEDSDDSEDKKDVSKNNDNYEGIYADVIADAKDGRNER